MTFPERYLEYRKIINDKVLGKIQAVHDNEGHKYLFVDSGKVVRSVTTKLGIIDKPQLIPWSIKVAFEYMDGIWQNNAPESVRNNLIKIAQEVPNTIRDEAADIGHVAHDVIEKNALDKIEYLMQMFNGSIVMSQNAIDRTDDIRNYIPAGADAKIFAITRSAERAFRDFDCIPLATEILVGDEDIAAGTLDMLVMNKLGEVELWDWKSSNYVHDTYALQVEAYREFFERMTGIIISRVRIVHLSKECDEPTMYYVPGGTQSFEAFVHASALYDIMNNGKTKLELDVKKITI